MGNVQCQTNDCKIQDFNIKILKQTVNARTNYIKSVQGSSTTSITYPPDTAIEQLYMVEWKDDDFTRDGWLKHAQVKLSVNEDGKVDKHFKGDINMDTLIETSQEGYTTATGYQLGDELKISKTNVPNSDLAQSTGDFEFKLIQKHPDQSSINYLWLSLILCFIASIIYIYIDDIYQYGFKTTFRNKKLIYGALLSAVFYPFLIAICFMIRNDKKNLEEFEGTSYPHTVHEKWTLAIPAIPLLIGAVWEMRSKGYSALETKGN